MDSPMKLVHFVDGSLWLSGDNLKAAEKHKDHKDVAGPDGVQGKKLTVHEFFNEIHPRADSDEEDE